MPDIRTEHLDDGAVFVLTTDPDAEWAYSKFPNPLITADYDADGRLFQIVAVGKAARDLSTAVHGSLMADLNELTGERDVIDDVNGLLVAA